MSTRPAKSPSASSTAAACVASLDSDDVGGSGLLLPLPPAATSARATMVMRIKRTESPAFLVPQSPIKRYCGHYTQRCSLAPAYGPTPRVVSRPSLFTLLPRRCVFSETHIQE